MLNNRLGTSAALAGLILAALLLAGGVMPTVARAQQPVVSAPFNTTSEGFFEGFGFSGALSGPNWFAQWGGAVAPPIGAGAAGTPGMTTGWSIGGHDWSGRFGFSAMQGFDRSSSSIAPSGTMMNGHGMTIGDQTFSPFVLGVVPVVGDYVEHPAVVPWQQQLNGAVPRQEASPEQALRLEPEDADQQEVAPADANAADPPAARSVAAIRRQQRQAAEDADREALANLDKARQAITAGKPAVARIHLKMAARRASADLLPRVEAQLRELGD